MSARARGPAIHQEGAADAASVSATSSTVARRHKDMAVLPDMIFVIDKSKEGHSRSRSAGGGNIGCGDRRIQIQTPRDHLLVPGNDDAGRAFSALLRLVARARDRGISRAARAIRGSTIGHRHSRPRRKKFTRRAQAEGLQGIACPRGTADDIKELTGVSGVRDREEAQRSRYLPSYWQLAELDCTTPEHRSRRRRLTRARRCWVAQGQDVTRNAENAT